MSRDHCVSLQDANYISAGTIQFYEIKILKIVVAFKIRNVFANCAKITDIFFKRP